MSKPFKLSSVLYGHSLDVRSVVVTSDNSIISGSRDKTAKFWRSNMFNADYTNAMTFKDQKNFVACVLYLLPSDQYPDGLVVTGGNDKMILVYKPSEPFATFRFNEHSDTVCCLSSGLEPNTFMSGSWDTTAKAWSINNTNSSIVTFSGHQASIWSVIQLSNGNIATACADKTIGVWMRDGQRIRLLTGHTDCVRDLCDFPELGHFLSVANDASIKVWTYEGENIETLYGHTNYIYSIARNKANGMNSFVTSDEDRTIRCWQDGTNTQIINLPAQSIWSVACLSNGDIVAGASDGMIRVFTQDESRYASESALKNFEEEVNSLKKQVCQEIGGYKVSDLPGKEALYDPGKKPGQMKMIREGDGVVAYTWVEDGDNSHWEKVGDVLGANEKENEGKTLYEGRHYDFVFSVDVEDGKPPLKLPYNKGEDVYAAANKFLERNFLPAVYLDQVVEFIHKNAQESTPFPMDNNYVDPFTGGSRYTPTTGGNPSVAAGTNMDPLTGGTSYTTSNPRPTSSTQMSTSRTNLDPFTGGSSYSTQGNTEQAFFPHMNYIRFDMGDPKVVMNKLIEFNLKVGAGNSNINQNTIQAVVNLCTQPYNDEKTIDALFELLEWPSDVRFPAIDVLRFAVRDAKNNACIVRKNNGSVILQLKEYIGKDCGMPNNTLVAFRAICNMFLHPHGEELIFANRIDLMEDVTALLTSNKNIEIGMATFLLNLTILILKRKDEVGLVLLASVLPDIILNINDTEAIFRALVAMGTLITVPQKNELVAKICENATFIEKLKQLASLYGTDLELKRKKCAEQVQTKLQC